MKSTAQNLQLWEQRINERVQGGMTIEEWCKKNGVSKHKYNYWNLRVSKVRNTDVGTTFAILLPTAWIFPMSLIRDTKKHIVRMMIIVNLFMNVFTKNG